MPVATPRNPARARELEPLLKEAERRFYSLERKFGALQRARAGWEYWLQRFEQRQESFQREIVAGEGEARELLRQAGVDLGSQSPMAYAPPGAARERDRIRSIIRDIETVTAEVKADRDKAMRELDRLRYEMVEVWG